MSADRQVLSFAAVRLHGRAFLLMLTVAPGLPSELAIRIADVVKPAAEVTVTVATPDSNEGERAAVRAEEARPLEIAAPTGYLAGPAFQSFGVRGQIRKASFRFAEVAFRCAAQQQSDHGGHRGHRGMLSRR